MLKLCAAAPNLQGHRRAFEALCLLLHEPQLKACVPVTCVGVVRAFLCSPFSSEPVAIASLDLLTILHTRLQALILPPAPPVPTTPTTPKGAKGPSADEQDKATMARYRAAKRRRQVSKGQAKLMATCWLPILDAMAQGAKDGRRTLVVKLHGQ